MVDTPFRIGVCMEWNAPRELLDDFYDAVRLACDEGLERGTINRPVELITRELKGPMAGLNSDVMRAYRQLAYEDDVLAILGPVVTEANLAIRDEVTRARMPTISFCATLDWAGPYCYALQNGAFVDEAPLLAAYMRTQGWNKVAVLHEEGTIGDEFLAAFRQAARLNGLKIVSDHTVGLFATMEPVAPQLEAVKATAAQCLVAFAGYGAISFIVDAVQEMRDAGTWDLPCLKNFYPVEGWTALHQIHPGNTIYQHALDAFEQRHGRRPTHAYVPLGYDHGQVLVEALGTMKPPSPEGFNESLKKVRMVPAAIGAPGTRISFGEYDHRGYKGDYIVFGSVKDGKDEIFDVSWAELLQTPAEVLRPVTDRTQGAARTRAVGGITIPSVERTPYRIGVCQDYRGLDHERTTTYFDGLRLAFEEALSLGLLDREVELVIRERDALGSLAEPHIIVDDWRQLAFEEDCVAIVGPHWTDVCLVIRDEVERGRVPTLSYCATVDFNGEYCFAAPNGTFMDETHVIAAHLIKRDARTVGVIHEDNPIGDEYFQFFRRHCRRLGLNIVADRTIRSDPTLEEVGEALHAIRNSGADSLAHMGIGRAFPVLCEAARPLVKDGWDIPRVTITIWVHYSGVTGDPAPWNKDMDLDPLEGWVGIDVVHEENARHQSFLRRFETRFGQRIFQCYPAHMYDMGWVLALALSRARPVTPDGVRDALERIRMVPSTAGGPGSVLSFGPRDHRGYKGANYLVLRTVQNGVEGRVEEFGL